MLVTNDRDNRKREAHDDRPNQHTPESAQSVECDRAYQYQADDALDDEPTPCHQASRGAPIRASDALAFNCRRAILRKRTPVPRPPVPSGWMFTIRHKANRIKLVIAPHVIHPKRRNHNFEGRSTL